MPHRSSLWSMTYLICDSARNGEKTGRTDLYRIYRTTGEHKMSANRCGSGDTSEPPGYCE